ncbi:hypothetical protein SUGI_0380030 [Cryptomeria japonica]|nr:hypothetical protein SUGI_0380030 [Cryptomeria japonica]
MREGSFKSFLFCLIRLPNELWMEDILCLIGNMLGRYIHSVHASKGGRVASSTRIYVWMDLRKVILHVIKLNSILGEMVIEADYEGFHISCFNCDRVGNMARQCKDSSNIGSGAMHSSG